MSDQQPDRPAGNGPRKLNRGALIVVGALTVAVAVSVGLIAAGSHGGGTTLTGDAHAASNTSSSPASSAAPHSTASAPWSSTDCKSQLASWRSTGAGGQLQVVVTDIALVTQAAASLSADLRAGTASSASVAALNSAAASLRSSTQVATKNLIPGCVAGTHQAEVKGLTDLGDAVAGFGTAVTGAGRGDYGNAQRDMQTGIAAVQSGSAEMAVAIAGLHLFGFDPLEPGKGRALLIPALWLAPQEFFHARIAAERAAADGGFTVDDVAETLTAKLVRRHPHVFADTGGSVREREREPRPVAVSEQADLERRITALSVCYLAPPCSYTSLTLS